MAHARSAVKDVDRLIADLHAADSVRRDAAVARLRIIGSRAVTRLADVIASDSQASTRSLALTVLEGVEDARGADVALGALGDADPDVVISALGVLRLWVTNETGTRLLDAIAAIAVDPARHTGVRVAALDALSDLPEHLVQPIRAQAPSPESAAPPLNDPVALFEWVEAQGATAPLSTLHELIARTREQEREEASARRRADWLRARGLAHRVLATRHSLVAVYDLRETFEAATETLPQDFLAAAAAIGDASCLEPLARAWAASPTDLTWRHQLAGTASTIVRRTKLSGRTALIKRLKVNFPGFV